MTLPTRSDLSLLGRWLRARVRIQLRTGRAVVFTFAFPLVLLVLFNGLNGNATVDAVGAAGKVKFAQFYTPSIGIFSLTTACYTSVIVGIATARDSGLLKRVRGTPLPMSIYLGSWLAGAALTGIVAVALLFVVAVPAFGVHVYARTLPAAIVTLGLGAACLASVGLAVATLSKTADQAMPIAQLTFLPVSFISGIWFPLDGAPEWIVKIAHFFPLYHLVNAFDGCFVPGVANNGWKGDDLLALAIWTAIQGDLSFGATDPKVREAAEDHMALLTPVIKAFSTDMGFTNAVLAQQIWGGHGYIAENGMEQFVRDARINQIYEGANGVQAMDLVGRKLGLNGGRPIKSFGAEVEGYLREHAKTEVLAPYVTALGAAISDLQQAALWLAKQGASDGKAVANEPLPFFEHCGAHHLRA